MTKWIHLAGALIICALGGFAFTLINAPAPWLAGSMLATLPLLAAGARFEIPSLLRDAVFLLLGTQIGAAVNWQTVAGMGQWPLSLVFLALTVTAIVVSGMAFFRRSQGWDEATAFFAAVPGALSLVLMVAMKSGADMARVTVVQSFRLVFLVAALPLLITGLGPAGGTDHPSLVQVSSASQAALAIAAGGGVGALFAWARVPAGLMLGAAFANGVLHLLGIVSGALPPGVLTPAYVVLGAAIGDRFAGVRAADIMATLWVGFGGFLLSLSIALVGALAASRIAGVPLADALVAFAPGGLEAMSALGIALGLDPAYVGVHQIARYLGLSIALPVITGLFARHWLEGQKRD
jgi:membrane AbrB-like protein